MNEPWFNPNYFAWIPGTVIGVFIGLWGALTGVLAPQGKARTFVMGFWGVLFFASIALLVTAIIALIQQQPYGIWYGLGLPGLIGTVLLSSFFFVVRLRYSQAEAQRLQAQDL